MKKHIEVIGDCEEVMAYIEVDEKYVDLAKQRMEALVKRWDANELEMANNGRPLYTKDTYFDTLLDMYLVKDYLVGGPEISYEEYDCDYDKADIVASYTFEDLDDNYW